MRSQNADRKRHTVKSPKFSFTDRSRSHCEVSKEIKSNSLQLEQFSKYWKYHDYQNKRSDLLQFQAKHKNNLLYMDHYHSISIPNKKNPCQCLSFLSKYKLTWNITIQGNAGQRIRKGECGWLPLVNLIAGIYSRCELFLFFINFFDYYFFIAAVEKYSL